jgi:uncharacterized protein YraI
MKFRLRSVLLAFALAAAAAGAGAQQVAYAAKPVNLRAGPDRSYPVVLVLAEGTQVVVQGCIPDYRWCDVAIGYDRGWVYAGNLRTAWGDRLLPLPNVAPLVGIVVAPFVIEDYWGLYYRNRPWYSDRYRWPHPAPRVLAPSRPHPGPPPGHAAPPPGHVGPPPGHAGPPRGHVRPPPPGGAQPGVHAPHGAGQPHPEHREGNRR